MLSPISVTDDPLETGDGLSIEIARLLVPPVPSRLTGPLVERMLDEIE
jgi:hypothetical protein